MQAGMSISGQGELLAKLKAKAAQFQGKPRVTVGFSADYATVVHENTQAVHPNGEAKFLENAIREGRPRLQQQIKQDLRDGVPLDETLLNAGETVLADAQARCPVQTGYLRDSGYVDAGGGI